tara:strand:- start:1240 stop:1380 length:141 start_codon:yes stop_codon:yes gene_type:complete
MINYIISIVHLIKIELRKKNNITITTKEKIQITANLNIFSLLVFEK